MGELSTTHKRGSHGSRHATQGPRGPQEEDKDEDKDEDDGTPMVNWQRQPNIHETPNQEPREGRTATK